MNSLTVTPWQGFCKWFQAHSITARIVAMICAAFVVLSAILIVVDAINHEMERRAFVRLSSAEHLSQAETICGPAFLGQTGDCLQPVMAGRHLEAIKPSDPEYVGASKLLALVGKQEQLEHQHQEEVSRYHMLQNVQGEAHDAFTCATSTDSQPIMSFNGGRSWWRDDGRCAAREQRQRDDDAQVHSYWSTTVRVDTDMDSTWLPQEERSCQSVPGGQGRVAAVHCDGGRVTNDHNIPVEFWGGVDRNRVSNWKCRREKDFFADKFVCRAVD